MSPTCFSPPVASSSASTASSASSNQPQAPTSTSSLLTPSTVALAHSAPPTSTSTSTPTPRLIAPLRAFSPPKWIFSQASPWTTTTQVGDDDIRGGRTVASSSSSVYDPHRAFRDEPRKEERQRFPAYAPKRPGIRFVKASLATLTGGDDESKASQESVVVEGNENGGERTQVSKGSQVRGLYESLVGLKDAPRLDERLPKLMPMPMPISTKSKISSPPPPPEKRIDLDLTNEQSDLDSNSDEDDIIILDPTTRLAEPLLLTLKLPHTKRARPNPPLGRAIHELLPSRPLSSPNDAQAQGQQGQGLIPLILPMHYAIPSTNIGWRILERQGWKEGTCLGVVKQGKEEGGLGSSPRGLKVPLKASDKFDRKGLGKKDERDEEEGSKKKERDKELKRRDLVEVEKRGKGNRGIELRQREDMKERKELLAYMNRA